ncbi:hypothetical protein GGI26_004822 [Coemansia sp. RSA 1358]|uniref:Uncharacterized protein n=1 Tax=Coemansia umbellata TaxID=1424467 RepID=A0ABQ8PJ35_9FUNG|nr:hypothetical protein EDC05_004380 [Coemansia umbellata]KAJ2620660.1 hypothetical protein GGI26_004822 [Coemansia sp. RSA 1358]
MAVSEPTLDSESGSEQSSSIVAVPAVTPGNFTVLVTVYAGPDVPTVTVTKTETSYFFSFTLTGINIVKGANLESSVIAVTEYDNQYVMTEVNITPPVPYTTEYITKTIAVTPVLAVSALTTTITDSTTVTETITATTSTQDNDATSTYIIGEVITELSTLIDTSLQTEALWTQTLLYSSSTSIYTVKSLNRLQPRYTSTVYLQVTETHFNTMTTTTTTPPPSPFPESPQKDQSAKPGPNTTSSPSSSTTENACRAAGLTILYCFQWYK